MSGVRVEARRGRYDLCNPSKESWAVSVRGMRPLLEDRVPEFAKSEWFSLSIPESKADEIEGAEGYELLHGALVAQSGWWIATDKKPAAELLRLLDEDETFSDMAERAILEYELSVAERALSVATDRRNAIVARMAKIETRLSSTAGGAA